MRLDKAFIPSCAVKGSGGNPWRQITAAGLILLLGACSSAPKVQQGTVGFVQGFLGGVAADEPRAATIGRDVLSAGGTAADAATAIYFALSVTMPSAASLGGGGECVVHDWKTKKTETLDFLARVPAVVPAAASRPSAVPGNPRGFFALQSRFGRLRWESLVGPAENLARFGTPASRAFANDLAQVGGALLAEPETRRIFGADNGQRVAREGDLLTQFELAATLAQIRRAGPGDFYDGPLARQFVAAVKAAGGSLDVQDMRGYLPVWRDTAKVPFGNVVAHFASPPGAAGVLAAQMWRMLTDKDLFADASEAERNHLLAEAAMRAFADRGRWLREDGTSGVPVADLVAPARAAALMASFDKTRHTPAAQLDPPPVERLENPSGTSFIVVDREGSAVSCELTMNNLFGTGRFAGGTGVLLAALPGPAGRGPTSLGPLLVVNEHVNELIYAGASSGGAPAATALINVAARAMLGKEPLAKAMQASRIHHEGVPDVTFVEPGLAEAARQDLAGRGHQVAVSPLLGRVNAAHCPAGLPGHVDSCVMAADVPPRGYGLMAAGSE